MLGVCISLSLSGRNPADLAGLDNALMGENLDYKFLQNQDMLGLLFYVLYVVYTYIHISIYLE